MVAFGAVEQHGHHLPLGTDSISATSWSRRLADRLDAFHAPTVRVGCSRHHLAFPGTMSIEEETFQRVVVDIVRGWAGHGFRRIVLLPTHGGNFAPLAGALEQLEPLDGVKVIAISDLGAARAGDARPRSGARRARLRRAASTAASGRPR